MSLGTLSDTVTVTLTKRELTLIRVACLLRLDKLKRAQEGYNPLNSGDAFWLGDLVKSYDETRALLDTGGVLYKAAREAGLIR